MWPIATVPEYPSTATGLPEWYVLAENKAMQFVFARTGWVTRTRRDGSAVHVMMRLPDDLG